MAKGMLSLTAALLLSAMCAVEGQNAASGAAAAGGDGGLGGGAAAAAAAAATGGGDGGPGAFRPGYGGPGYNGGGRYLPYRYRAYIPVRNTYLPPGIQYTTSRVNALKKIKSSSGVGIFDNLFNHLADIDAFNNVNG